MSESPIEYVTVLCFAAVTFTAAGLGLLLKDLLRTREGSRRRPRLERDPLLVRRDLLDAKTSALPKSPLQRFDRWFYNLVLEPGRMSLLAAMLLLLCCSLVAGSFAWILQQDPASAAVYAALGMLLPLPFLMRSQRLYRSRIQEQLPNALDLLSRAVRAGESVDQAIALCGEQSPAPLAKEFRRCAKQLEMGLALPVAMRCFGQRVRLPDAKIFTAAVAVHREAGGNLARTLERMAHVIRDRMTYRRQLRAVTAAGRFSATMVSLAGPLLFAYMFVFQHDYVNRLLVDPLGKSLLALAVILEIVGLVWVIRMQQSD